MADWTTIADTAVDPDAPVTSELGYAWRDNPIAIAEGAPDAPKVSAVAQSHDFWLSRQQVVNDGGGAPIWTDLDRVRMLQLVYERNHGSNIFISFSADNGTSFGSEQTLAMDSVVINRVWLDLESGEYEAFAGDGSGVNRATLTVPSNVNAFRLRLQSGGASGDYCRPLIVSGRAP